MNSKRADLAQLTLLFLKLGTVAFGGPAAHIAMMEDEVVRRRGWLTQGEFLDLLGATNLIPGPNSTEMAIHIGHRRAGWAGLVVAGSCFILPAAIIVGILSWAYVRFGRIPQAEGILYGVKPVVLAIVLQAIWRLVRSALRTRFLWIMGGVVAVLSYAGVNELVLLFGTGMAAAAAKLLFISKPKRPSGFMPGLGSAIIGTGTATAASAFGLWPMFLVFLKIGSVLFGSGYVLLVFLRADLVDRLHWLTEGQLLDAIAIGQITPGPVFTTATFIGYVLSGIPGAFLATAGIFLPAFFFVAISGPLVPCLRRSQTAGAFLDGVNTASLALMTVVTIQLARTAFVDYGSIVIGTAAAVLLIRNNQNTTWLVLGAAIAGIMIRLTNLHYWLRI